MSDTVLRSKLIRLASTLPVGSRDRQELLAVLSETPKKAALKDGPLGRVFDVYWNMLHDFEYDLGKVIKEYGSAASYRGGAGAVDAKQVESAIRTLAAQIEAISLTQMDSTLALETRFIQRHGEPETYVVQQRNRMFPR